MSGVVACLATQHVATTILPSARPPWIGVCRLMPKAINKRGVLARPCVSARILASHLDIKVMSGVPAFEWSGNLFGPSLSLKISTGVVQMPGVQTEERAHTAHFTAQLMILLM